MSNAGMGPVLLICLSKECLFPSLSNRMGWPKQANFILFNCQLWHFLCLKNCFSPRGALTKTQQWRTIHSFMPQCPVYLSIVRKRPVCLTRGPWVKPVSKKKMPAWRSQIRNNCVSGVSLKIPASKSLKIFGRTEGFKLRKVQLLIQADKHFFLMTGLQTELDFKSLLLLPTLP